MAEIKRWYDASRKVSEMFYILKSLPAKELDKIAIYLYQVVNIYWKQAKHNNQPISIGKEKLLGYYKAYQKRRWYDKNPSLSSAINMMSTFSVRETEQIVDGFLLALKEAGLDKIYLSKKKEIQEKK